MATQIISFVRSAITNGDEYSLEVLYYFLRKNIADNYGSLKNISDIEMGKLYFETPIIVNVSNKYRNQKSSFALLLSVRALMLESSLLAYCNDNYLIFKSYTTEDFGWVNYAKIINRLFEDSDFREIFNLLCLAQSNQVNKVELKKFEQNTISPHPRNELNYYKDIAALGKSTETVICDNSFVCDLTMSDYTVPKEVRYIGNTAFAYCEGLKTLRFLTDHVLFGIFPIIECSHLQKIVVPSNALDYYKEALPYYKDIIVQEDEKIEQNCQSKSNTENFVRENLSRLIGKFNPTNTAVAGDRKAPVDTSILSEVFKHTNATYKFLWFYAILDSISTNKERKIELGSIAIKMLVISWTLIFNKKISFGYDYMDYYISVINNSTRQIKKASLPLEVETYLVENSHERKVQETTKALLSNVPYRFLSPWIKFCSVSQVRADSCEEDYQGPYSIYKDYIVINEPWMDYFLEHMNDIKQFVWNSFLEYLRKYNTDRKLSFIKNEPEGES